MPTEIVLHIKNLGKMLKSKKWFAHHEFILPSVCAFKSMFGSSQNTGKMQTLYVKFTQLKIQFIFQLIHFENTNTTCIFGHQVFLQPIQGNQLISEQDFSKKTYNQDGLHGH